MSLEHELKRALRAEDPGDAFTARVLARVKADAAAAQSPAPRVTVRLNGAPRADAHRDANQDAEADAGGDAGRARTPAAPLAWPGARTRTRADGPPPADVTAPRRTRARWVWAAATAASLLVSGAGGVQWMNHRQETAEGERARAEVLAALRLTSAKLSLVRHAVAGSEDTH